MMTDVLKIMLLYVDSEEERKLLCSFFDFSNEILWKSYSGIIPKDAIWAHDIKDVEEIKGCNKLWSITFDKDYDKWMMPGDLPDSLQIIRFEGFYGKNLTNILPKSLETLICDAGVKWRDVIFPSNLLMFRTDVLHECPKSNTLIIGDIHDCITIPKHVRHLVISGYFNRNIKKGFLPEGLKTLELSGCFNGYIWGDAVPDSVHTIVFGMYFNKVLYRLPKSLVSLTFGNNYNKSFRTGILPASLREIIFGENFNKQLTLLPEGLEKIVMGKNYDKAIPIGPEIVRLV